MEISESNGTVADDLRAAVQRLGRNGLADHFDVDEKTIRRWEKGEIPHPGLLQHAVRSLLASLPVRQAESADFTFIDLFAGIGGIRLAFEAAGGRNVFTSEIDRFAQATLRANFPEDDNLTGDIREITGSSDDPADHRWRLDESIDRRIDEAIPDHDVLTAGFPCQPFSVAGVSKLNALGRKHGFLCQAQGTLFFDVARILKVKRPPAVLLENVKNLRSHDGGKTYQMIRKTLEEDLGYRVHDIVIDGRGFVPQHRERIYMVCFREDTGFTWDDLPIPDRDTATLGDILHPEDGSEEPENPYTTGPKAAVNPRYTLSTHLWRYLRDYSAKHRARGNGFGYSLFGPDDVARTLSARYHKDGSEILISRGKRARPRRLTPRECARLMGFPSDFKIPVSDTQAYRQFGNSVVVPVVTEVAQLMKPYVISLKNAEETRQTPLAV